MKPLFRLFRVRLYLKLAREILQAREILHAIGAPVRLRMWVLGLAYNLLNRSIHTLLRG